MPIYIAHRRKMAKTPLMRNCTRQRGGVCQRYQRWMFCEGKLSACQLRNGGCSNLCIPLMTGFTCACPDFSRLAHDNATCISGQLLTKCSFNSLRVRLVFCCWYCCCCIVIGRLAELCDTSFCHSVILSV